MDPLEHFFRRMAARDDISSEEQHAVRRAVGASERLPPRTSICRLGDRPHTSTLIASGYAARVVPRVDGSRQIVALHMAGDFVDLHSFPLKLMDHDVETVSDCQVVYFAHEALRELTESHPHLMRVLWLLTLMDSAIQRQWLALMGTAPAPERMAHLICEQFLRAESVGLVQGQTFAFPLTQQDLGDVLGLSVVHVNRTLQSLRQSGLVAWENGRVELLDRRALLELAQFEPEYLHFEKLPR